MTDAVVKSAARVLEVFEFFAKRRSPASVSDVCLALGYPQSSTSVLLKSLLSLGYVSYDAVTRRYSPTTRVALLGNWIEESSAGLIGLLEDLRRETGETVVLAQQNGVYVQFVQILDAAGSRRIVLPVGMRYPLAGNAAGRLLLAEMSDAQILRIVRRANAQETRAEDRVDENALLAAIADVRRTGYALTETGLVPGIGMLATFAPPVASQPTLVVGIAAPVERLRQDQEMLLAALRRAAPAQSPKSVLRDHAPQTMSPYNPGAARSLGEAA